MAKYPAVLWPVYYQAMIKYSDETRIAEPLAKKETTCGNAVMVSPEIPGSNPNTDNVVPGELDVFTIAPSSSVLRSAFAKWCGEEGRHTDSVTLCDNLFSTLTLTGLHSVCNRYAEDLFKMFVEFIVQYDVIFPTPETTHHVRYQALKGTNPPNPNSS